jgi:hypothetical protein
MPAQPTSWPSRAIEEAKQFRCSARCRCIARSQSPVANRQLLTANSRLLTPNRRSRPLATKAVVAIDRPVQPRHKRNSRLAAARCTRNRRPARRTTCSLPTSVGAAIRTALRLIQQALLEVEALLARREDERRPAIATAQGLVLKLHVALRASGLEPTPAFPLPGWSCREARLRAGGAETGGSLGKLR